MQSLRLKDGEGGAALIVKRFALPERFPFDTSDGNFAITNETRIATMGLVSAGSPEQSAATRAGDKNRERVRGRIGRRQRAADRVNDEENRVLEQESARNTVPQGTAGTGAKARMLSASTANGGSLYIYSYDGRLLAEYNRFDQCVKDYIYIGNRLLAEYKPQEEEMYFYTPDQINSTRIVTDSTGTVVYSAAHDPYGGIQQTWENTYDPTPKFSGKERDAESGLDYFGARYYDKELYRFISVDPVINKSTSLFGSQKLNLYSYCMDNPISFLDPDGKDLIPVTLPGANGKPLYTFLDSAFYPRVTALIDLCSFWGIQLEFTSGYRTQRQQDDIRKANPNAALKSVHSTGWAVDINWNGLSWLERIVVPFYGRILGFIWGGTAFGKYYDPVHFQITPPGGTRQSWIDQAAEDYVLYFYGLPDMTPMEIYMRYGVFTVSAAEKIICGSI